MRSRARAAADAITNTKDKLPDVSLLLAAICPLHEQTGVCDSHVLLAATCPLHGQTRVGDSRIRA